MIYNGHIRIRFLEFKAFDINCLLTGTKWEIAVWFSLLVQMSFGTKDFRVPPHRWIIIKSQIEINRDNTSRCTKLLFIDTNLEWKYDWCTFGMVQLWICDSFNATWGGDTGALLHFLCTSIEKASVYEKLSYKTIFINGYCNFNLHYWTMG